MAQTTIKAARRSVRLLAYATKFSVRFAGGRSGYGDGGEQQEGYPPGVA